MSWSIMVREALVTQHLPSRSKEQWRLVLRSLSPFRSAQEPSYGTGKLGLGWASPLCQRHLGNGAEMLTGLSLGYLDPIKLVITVYYHPPGALKFHEGACFSMKGP